MDARRYCVRWDLLCVSKLSFLHLTFWYCEICERPGVPLVIELFRLLINIKDVQ